MAVAREVNRYLDEQAPWFQIKQDRDAAARSVYVALRAIDSLKTLTNPFLPFSSQQLHELDKKDYLEYKQREHTDQLQLQRKIQHPCAMPLPAPGEAGHQLYLFASL